MSGFAKFSLVAMALVGSVAAAVFFYKKNNTFRGAVDGARRTASENVQRARDYERVRRMEFDEDEDEDVEDSTPIQFGGRGTSASAPSAAPAAVGASDGSPTRSGSMAGIGSARGGGGAVPDA